MTSSPVSAGPAKTSATMTGIGTLGDWVALPSDRYYFA